MELNLKTSDTEKTCVKKLIEKRRKTNKQKIVIEKYKNNQNKMK